jgi:hypothetical protein
MKPMKPMKPMTTLLALIGLAVPAFAADKPYRDTSPLLS